MSDTDSCVCCNRASTSGSATGSEVDRWIDCHLCNRWSHIECFENETHSEGAVTSRLWESLESFIQTFRFTCSRCGAATSLPAQIEAQGLLSRQILTDLGVQSKYLVAIEPSGAVGGAPPPSIQPTVVAPPTATADLQSILNMFMIMQEKSRAEDRAEREKREADRVKLETQRLQIEQKRVDDLEKARSEERAERERIEAARIKSEEKREAEREKTRSEERAERERERREDREIMQSLLRQREDAEERRQDNLEKLIEGVQSGAPTTSEAKSHSGGLRLPELKLPMFGGDVLKWPEFWDIFRAMIDQNRGLSDVQKLSHLRANLSGPAKDTISSLRMTDDNYSVAVALLKSRFGDNSRIKDQLLDQLTNLSCCSMKFSELQQQFLTVEQILKQLQNLEADLKGDILWRLLAGKFSAEVNMKLDEAKAEANQRCLDWTVELYLESLERIVKLQGKEFEYRKIRLAENERHSGSSTSSQQQQSSSGIKGAPFPTSKSSADVMSVSGGTNSSNKGLGNRFSGSKVRDINIRKYPCIFCSGEHFPDDCLEYSTPEQRKNCLIKKRRCFMCFRDNHSSGECFSPWKMRPCKGCLKIGHHHYSLCRDWSAKKNPTAASQAGADSDAASGGEEATEPENLVQNSMAITGVSRTSVNQRHSAMQIAEVVVKNPTNGRMQTASVFFDTGSSGCWMSSSFARQVGIQRKNSFSLGVKAFGSKKPEEMKAYRAKLDLAGFRIGHTVRCEFVVVDNLTVDIQRPSLSYWDLEFLKKNQKRYKLAYGNMPTEFDKIDPPFSPDLIIGQDYYWSMVEGGARATLPSGFKLIPSMFGYLIGGSNCIECPKADSNALEIENSKVNGIGSPEVVSDTSRLTPEESISSREPRSPAENSREVVSDTSEKSVTSRVPRSPAEESPEVVSNTSRLKLKKSNTLQAPRSPAENPIEVYPVKRRPRLFAGRGPDGKNSQNFATGANAKNLKAINPGGKNSKKPPGENSGHNVLSYSIQSLVLGGEEPCGPQLKEPLWPPSKEPIWPNPVPEQARKSKIKTRRKKTR